MDTLPDAAFDNLYKFAAIAGISIIVASAWIPVHAIVDLWQQVQAYNIEAGELRADIEWRDAQAGIATTMPARDLRSVPQEVAKAIGKLEAQRASIESTTALMKKLSAGGGAGAGIGLLIASWGFWKWRRHQLMLDEILSHEAARARAALHSNEKSAT